MEGVDEVLAVGELTRGGGTAAGVDRQLMGRRGRAAVGDILVTLLSAPERIPSSALDVIVSQLGARCGDDNSILALRSVAAIAYARPDLLRRSIVSSLARLMTGPLSPPLAAAAAETFEVLATTALGPAAARALMRLLARRRLDPIAREALLRALRPYVEWRPRLITLEAMMRAGRAAPDGRHRDLILREAIERRVFTAPRLFREPVLERLIATFRDRARLRYSLAALASQPGVPRRARERAARWLAPRFAIGPTAVVDALGHGPRSVLVIQNIADGQGDEILRTAPLVQALLDAHPSLTVTIVSQRNYLYDHPRVTAASIHDARAVDQALEAPVDALVEFDAAEAVTPSYRPELASRVTEYIATCRPSVVLRAINTHVHVTFETVQIAHQPLARALQLHRLATDNAYDPTERLLIELRLPVRAGEQSPRGGSLLTGRPSLESADVWGRLRGRGDRPVALVNAFGGGDPLKGFTRDKADRLAGALAGLIDEGFSLVLLPNGQPWGGLDAIAATLGLLDGARRSRIAIAPDPSGRGPAEDLGRAERPGLSHADRVMRLFKYFASYADLIVTIEGWLVHLAYGLGRPFRVLLAPHSIAGWLPRGRSARQELVTSMSPTGAPETGDLLGDDDPAPTPWYPRKSMLVAAVRGLALVDRPEAARMLRKLLDDPDRELRIVAVETLGRRGPIAAVKPDLIRALGDQESLARAAAARLLVDAGVECDRELGAGARAQLEAHQAIARQDWTTVEALGVKAVPALAVATRDARYVIRREACELARRLIERHAPGMLAGRRS